MVKHTSFTLKQWIIAFGVLLLAIAVALLIGWILPPASLGTLRRLGNNEKPTQLDGLMDYGGRHDDIAITQKVSLLTLKQVSERALQESSLDFKSTYSSAILRIHKKTGKKDVSEFDNSHRLDILSDEFQQQYACALGKLGARIYDKKFVGCRF